MATKVLIVDDHPAVRDGLAFRIASQPDLEVCGEAADMDQAVKLLEAARPDVAIVDIQLETDNGLDLVERIKAHDAFDRHSCLVDVSRRGLRPAGAYRPAPWVTSTSGT